MHVLAKGTIVSDKYYVHELVGTGAAGSVYRVTQTGLDIERAMKVLDPKNKADDFKKYMESFQKEIKTLSQLSHSNVSKIIDYGDHTIDGIEVHYFIMEYANSETLKNLQTAEFGAKGVLNLFSQVFDAICYLHERGILHFDIKPSNILVHRDGISGKTYAKLSDFGVTKMVEGHQHQLDLLGSPSDASYVFGTTRYAPPYASRLLNSGTPVKREEIQSYLPHFDLYCLGASLAEVISRQPIRTSIHGDLEELLGDLKPEICTQLDHGQTEYLCNFIRQLVVNDPRKGYRSAKDAQDAFARLDTRYAIPREVPEISNVGSRRAITHGNRLVRMSERTYRIICHPTFQRLQRLNQLNLVESIYPEARQTRFSHSLEVYELAKKAASHLLGEGVFRLHVSAREIGLFLVSALLHDIGHYPLAHTIEDLKNSSIRTNQKPKSDYEMVRNFLTETPESGGLSLSDILLSDWDVSADEVLRIVTKADAETIAESLFKQIIDGSIDIDKLAYLCHDSDFTGVSYGSGIDTEALIYSLRAFRSNPGKNPARYAIGLASKGVIPAENMIVARYHMFARVYWHHTNRAIMAMIHYAMRTIFENDHDYTFERYVKDTRSMSDIEALRYIKGLYDELRDKTPSIPENPIIGLVDNTRGIYKRLVSFSKHPGNSKLRHCHEFLGKAGNTKIDELREKSILVIKNILGINIPDSHVLFDIPSITKDGMSDIYVHDPSSEDEYILLHSASAVIGAVQEDFQWLARKSRVLIHPDIRKELRSQSSEHEAAKAVEDLIAHAARLNT